MQHDVWYALRRLRTRPLHTAVVVGILAIGTGAALTVFRVADALLLRALPYRAAERLVRVNMRVPLGPGSDLPFSDVGYRALESRSNSFELLASYRLVGVNITVGSNAGRVLSARVTGNFFDVLGLPAQRGRLFTRGAESSKGPPVVVLSDALWRSRFGADANVIGTIMHVDGVPATIIGVADPRVAFPAANVGYFTLMDLDPVGTSPFELGIEALGRLREGVSLATATAEASRIMQQVAKENPGPHSTAESDVSGFRAILRPLRDDIAGGIKPTLALLTTAVLFVLLLTLINVTTLELVRSTSRRTELAVRAALGAHRSRLIVGALVEGALLATAGVGAGLALSAAAVRTLQSLLPIAFGTSIHVGMSPGVLLATIAMIVLGAAASGVFPVIATLGRDLQSALRERDAATTRRLTRLRQGLIVAQITFACVLVHGAMLMIVSIRDAQRVALGFRTEGLVVFQVSLPRAGYPSLSEVSTTFNAITEALRTVPGVTHVGLANRIPLDANYSDGMIAVEGRPFKADGTDPNVDTRIVSAGYFAVMELRPAAGRVFTDGDSYSDGTPIVISRSTAKLLWPDGSDPIGHRLRTGPYAPWMPIIGVVDDVKNRSVTEGSRPEIYLPLGAPRSPVGVTRDVSIVVRAKGPLAAVQTAAERVQRSLNPELPLYGVRQYADIVQQSQIRERITMQTLVAFAVVALALAIAGSYAILMFAVMQRRRELALRQAVGATNGDLVKLVSGEMGKLVLIGAASGMTATIVMSRALATFLQGTSALDSRAFAATLAIVCLAGVVSTLLPARRATRTDLMSLLRME